jgi:phosphoribosyl 1,2-cyclic phosphodiesterase
LHFRFWGVRGSIPTPGEKTIRYGGNTTCIEVRGDHNELIVLDGGTGIFQLAQTLFPEFPIKINIFITHSHWDHIQGLPMFTPIFVPGNQVTIYGARDIVNERGVRDVLARQMDYAFFPVREAELKAAMSYVDLISPNQTVEIGSVKVSCQLMNHPVLNYAYRVECNGKSMVFTGDHEWQYNLFQPEDEEYQDFQAAIDEKRQDILDFFRGADALVIDTAYTQEEYPMRMGWGHGTFESSIAAACEAGVRQVYLTHHEPTRSDDALEKAFAKALVDHRVGEDEPRFYLAREGLIVEL